MARLREAGTDITRLAENGVEIFFTQVFKHNFFHADMHPGNIFVLIDNPAQPEYAAVDFGIVGTLDPRDQYYLAENFLAVFDRDYRRVATLHLESGWVPEGSRVDEMESAIRTVCEPIFNKPLKDISFGTVLLRLFEISRRFNVEIQPQLILLQKTLLNIEGLGRDLYPDLDIWKTAGPILREWVREKMSGRAVIENARTQIPEILTSLQTLAPLVRSAVQRAQDGRLRLAVEAPEINALRNEIRRTNRRRDKVTIAAVVLLGGIVWLALGRDPAWAGWALAGIGAAWLIAAIAGSGAAQRAGFLPITLHMIGDGIANSSRSSVARSASSCCLRDQSRCDHVRADLLEVHAHEIGATVEAVEHDHARLGVHLHQPQLAESAVQSPAEVTVLLAREVFTHGLGGRQRRFDAIDARVRLDRSRVEILDDQPAAGS